MPIWAGQSLFLHSGRVPPIMSSSGELTTKRIGGPWSQMSATDLAHDEDDNILCLNILSIHRVRNLALC